MPGCASEQTQEEEPAGSEDAVVASSVLEPSQIAELRQAGFSETEVQAVADSVVISQRLGAQSFVKEANDGDSAPGSAVRRESHGKSQGCLRAKVDVTTNLDVGPWKRGKSYPAWVRLSNGGAYQKDDKSTHISRGWGIKLLGVEGTRASTHDFLFITSPRFFIHDITHYPGFLKSSGNGRLGFVLNFLTNMSFEEKEVIVHRMRLKVANLLESPEYSAVPYRFGDQPVKYALARCGSVPPITPESKEPPAGAGEDYLQDAMNATLAASDPAKGVCYSFFVQRPRSEREDPVDNPTHAWEGGFEEVAKITIPHGQHEGGPSDYRANESECERMAFDPWNTTAESRPLGKTNWTRKAVYAALAKFRRVDMPKIYAKWMANHDDPTIAKDIRRELANLRDPASVNPTVKETTEPTVDEGFRKLGIVR
jgi:hypothetical protein